MKGLYVLGEQGAGGPTPKPQPHPLPQFTPLAETDEEYFARRSDEQRALADACTHKQAQIAHLELSARYAQLAAAIREAIARLD